MNRKKKYYVKKKIEKIYTEQMKKEKDLKKK